MLIKFELCQEIFEKYSNINFLKNPSSDSRVPCVRTDGRKDKLEYMKKLIVAFRTLANAPKNGMIFSDFVCSCKLLNLTTKIKRSFRVAVRLWLVRVTQTTDVKKPSSKVLVYILSVLFTTRVCDSDVDKLTSHLHINGKSCF